MNLDTLIKKLESAAELASNEEFACLAGCDDDGDDDGEPWLSIGKLWVIGPNDVDGLSTDDMQSIAIRHNTAAQVLSELKTQRARADRLHELFLRVSEAAGLELFESPTVVLGEVRNLRARTDEARAIINELAFCIDPNATCDAATELFARADKYLTEPTPPEPTP